MLIEYLTNNFGIYPGAAFIFILLIIGFAAFQKLIIWRLEYLAKKTSSDIDDAIVHIVKAVNPPFYFFIAFYIASRLVETSDQFDKYLGYIVISVIALQIAKAINSFIEYLTLKYSHLEENKEKGTTAMTTLAKVAKGIVWLIAILVILQNLGVEITSLIAGLGIGGVAIALAAQNILGDLFASFSIIFDKPFRVGDMIQIGDSIGAVKQIGIKTTRIQALEGEEIIIGNKELTSQKIQNYGKLKRRRVVFKIGVTYETKRATLKNIPTMIRKIIKSQKDVTLDRVNLSEFGDSAIIFECVYFIKSNDYNLYMDIQEDINYEILANFEKEKISMAYPTRVVYMKK